MPYDKDKYERSKPASLARQKKYRTKHKDREKLRHKKYNTEHREKVRQQQRNWVLLRKYGMTVDDYNKLQIKQQGKCAICGCSDYGKTGAKSFAVDHNHGTGKVRGLLCFRCNAALGNFEDNPELLRSALAYLEKHRV